MSLEHTTIKISKKTKKRIDSLKEYKRESYEDIIEKMLDVLNICKTDPSKAKSKLLQIDNLHRENLDKIEVKKSV